MNTILAFTAFILGVAGATLFIIGVFTTNPVTVLIAWLLILAFILTGWHAGVRDYQQAKGHNR
jgi:hypothetical protein